MPTDTQIQPHWTLDQIPYEAIVREQVVEDRSLFYLLAAASFVEITSDLYARNLVEYFAGDPPLQRWLAERWEVEEMQHGQALKRYVQTVWPDFDWELAYRSFLAEYSRFCTPAQLGPTRALELAARCVVETGTSSLYTTLARASPEPVLAKLATLIRNDEAGHYSHFYRHFRQWAQAEGTGRLAVLRTVWARVAEVGQEDAYYAFKHVFQVREPDQEFTDARYRALRHHYAPLVRRHYPYRAAAYMYLKPLGLNPPLRRVSSPLLAAGAWFLLLF